VGADKIWTGNWLWLENVIHCGALVSDGASAPKSSSGVEGTIALSPVPLIGMVKIELPSISTELRTLKVAVIGLGHSTGGVPVDKGFHAQLSCGAKVIKTVQLWPALRENGEDPQVSCSAKLG
jgi:hypothetical protein